MMLVRESDPAGYVAGKGDAHDYIPEWMEVPSLKEWGGEGPYPVSEDLPAQDASDGVSGAEADEGAAQEPRQLSLGL